MTVAARGKQAVLKWIIAAVVLLLAGGALAAHLLYRSSMSEAETALADLAARPRAAVGTFAESMLVGLPDVAQRYFRHAIAPGTSLHTTVLLQMEGVFLLGDVDNFTSYAMQARQILSPPSEFVWIPNMASGLMRIDGSDALVNGAGWTRFWINGLLPVANVRTSPDLVRSALSRSAMEAVWAPASLLPSNGVRWEQQGPNTARLSFGTGIEPVYLTLDEEGRVLEVVTARWSDANPEKTFRLQPFGGTAHAEITFGGFTIPSDLRVGNHYGTGAFLPFFQARVISAEYM